MPLYAYRATDEEGRPVEGRMEADTASEAVAHIQDRRLRVSSVDDATPAPIATSGQPLSWADIDMLNQQLLAVLKSGMPLSPSIRELAKEIPSRKLRGILEDVHSALDSGAGIDEAFERHAGKFSPVYLSMIRAGDRSGDLAGVLHLLTRQSNRALDLESRFWQAAAYPLLVILAAVAVVIFQCVYVVPVYREIFLDFGGRLPFSTLLLFRISDMLLNQASLLVIAVGLCLFLLVSVWVFLRRLPIVNHGWDRVKLSIPIFGPFYRAEMLARFSRALSIMLRTGVPLVESIDLASAASGNHALRRAGMGAATQVAQGTPISDALASTGYFGHTFNWLLGNAEQRGDVIDTLEGVADMYERAASNRGDTLSILAGPVLVLVVGIVVGGIFVSLYQPLFRLADLLGG